MDTDTIYRKLGEFVVSFQWLENRFREIGWLILDPHKKHWPPRALRNESFSAVVSKVEKLYLSLIDRLAPDDAEERKRTFQAIVTESHELRRYRNRLIHSAYIEVKAGGEVIGLVRSNPRLKEDSTSGELLWDREVLKDESFQSGMKRLAEVAFDLNMHYVQLIHWAPFDKTRRGPTKPSRATLGPARRAARKAPEG
jgi:hypothetical protein